MPYEDVVNALSPAEPTPKKKGILAKILEATPDILASFAEGYAGGAGSGNFAEAAAARGFSGGYKRGQAIQQENRIKESLNTLKETPEYKGFSPEEKTYYDVQPTELLKAVMDRKKTAAAAKATREAEIEKDLLGPNESAIVGKALGIDVKPGERLSSNFVQRMAAISSAEDRKAANEERRRAAAEREAEKTARNVDQQTSKFSKTVEDLGIPEAITQFKTIQKFMPEPGKDIPGVGMVDALVPGPIAGDAARAMRQAVQGLQNVKIKDRSGAAVTPPEFVRLKEEFGSGKFKTEAQFRQGVQQALNAYTERLRNAYAGVRPEIRDQYSSNQEIDDYLKTLSAMNFGGGQGGSSPAADSSGYVIGKQYKMKDGAMATYKGNGEFE